MDTDLELTPDEEAASRTAPTHRPKNVLFSETVSVSLMPPTRKYSNMAAGHADDFQTRPEALIPLLPYLSSEWEIWEPACGKGNLVRALEVVGYSVIGTDIRDDFDFLTCRLQEWRGTFDCIVTNPPFSRKDEFLARCYAIGKPFALLLPLTALEGQFRQSLYQTFGLQLMVLDRRVVFETPSGKNSGSWFSSAWFTWGLNLGSALTFAHLPREEKP